ASRRGANPTAAYSLDYRFAITFNPDERIEPMSAPVLFGQMTALADPTRSRLLLPLERNELTVNELTAILQLPQSTVSRHLKMLSAEGWVEARAEATSRF